MTVAQWLQREIETAWGVSCSLELAEQLVGGVFIQAAYDRARLTRGEPVLTGQESAG